MPITQLRHASPHAQGDDEAIVEGTRSLHGHLELRYPTQLDAESPMRVKEDATLFNPLYFGKWGGGFFVTAA